MRISTLLLSALALALAAAPVSAEKGVKKDKKKNKTSAAAVLAKQQGLETGKLDSAGIYQLSSGEQALDCKKLKGRMKVRILQVRDYEDRGKATIVARTMQSAATPIFGGPSYGTNPEGDYRKDLAMLEAYNKRLAEKNCKTLDLKAELSAPVRKTAPTPLPPSKPKS